MPRASSFTQAIADAICTRLADGQSLREICRDEGMPDKATVFRWLAADEAFRDQYAHAREAQAETLFEEIVTIADTQALGVKRTIKPDGAVETVEADMIEHRRLRVDARKWVVARLAPKKYGDKLTHASDPENPMTLTPVINVTIGKPESASSPEAG